MLLKYRIILFAALLAVAGVICLFVDFHSYHNNSRTVNCEANGLVFSITTYDGQSESEPFLNCLGHTWLSIDNDTDHSVYVHGYEVIPGETLTFSVWALTGHSGVVFNLEPNIIRQYGRYDGRESISVNIPESALTIIDKYIEEHDIWLPIQNCSYWSIHLWNEIVGEDLQMKTQTILYSPSRLQKSFCEYTCITTNRDFDHAGEIFLYQKGVRTEVRLCQ